MKPLYINKTAKTPEVIFDNIRGIIILRGISIPENPIEFFAPLQAWLKEYAERSNQLTTVSIYLEYFNTASSKFLLDLFKILEPIKQQTIVEWVYQTDNEDILMAGQEYKSFCKVSIDLVEV